MQDSAAAEEAEQVTQPDGGTISNDSTTNLLSSGNLYIAILSNFKYCLNLINLNR